MSDLFDEPDDATSLGPGEREGLLQTWITYRSELNQAENSNIALGALWARRGRRKDLLSETFLRTLHSKMFGEVWAWAGEFRRTERNIGVDPIQIPVDLRTTLDDACFWIEHETYPPDEIAVRLHHRIVVVHPFPNGNGRIARQMADLLAEQLGGKPFSWGSKSLKDIGEMRTRYIEALRAADAHDIEPLINFSRS